MIGTFAKEIPASGFVRKFLAQDLPDLRSRESQLAISDAARSSSQIYRICRGLPGDLTTREKAKSIRCEGEGNNINAQEHYTTGQKRTHIINIQQLRRRSSKQLSLECAFALTDSPSDLLHYQQPLTTPPFKSRLRILSAKRGTTGYYNDGGFALMAWGGSESCGL